MKVLSEQRRSSIRKKLVPVMGDDDAHAMIEALPSEGDRIVTEDFLDAKLVAFGEEMEKKFVTKDFLKAELAGVRIEIAGVRTEMADRFRRQTIWTSSTMVAGIAVVAAISKLV